ncbi:hypothetical protein TEA_005647 [Camellia sinensis var. sinensis]|uniref:Uncharacterized protein n=1 Tax=Camellia sinensis var. sinensis TaxID=542762 RepID=A0A4S4E3R1_CAMSN|nr:hypothetical protein TEA_005647 [Camellia sinensis var. sinensis]
MPSKKIRKKTLINSTPNSIPQFIPHNSFPYDSIHTIHLWKVELYLRHAARDEKRGTEAVENLKACGLSDIFFHQLDVTDSASIAYLADYIKNKFGKLNILVNNAGVNGVIMDAESFTSLKLKFGEKAEMAKKVIKQTYETAEGRLRTNYYRHKQLSQALIPLLRLSGSARIVNVLSSLGQLKENQRAMRISYNRGVMNLAENLLPFISNRSKKS